MIKSKDFDLKIKGSDTKSFELITTAFKEKREELQENKKYYWRLATAN